MTTEDENQATLNEQMRTLQTAVLSSASADSMLLVLSVAALFPVVQSIMNFSAASGRGWHDANSDSHHSDQTGLATTSMAVNSILRPEQNKNSTYAAAAMHRSEDRNSGLAVT